MKLIFVTLLALAVGLLLMPVIWPEGLTSLSRVLALLKAAKKFPTVTLRLKQSTFMQHEPIPLALTILNDTPTDVEFLDNRPTFTEFDDRGHVEFAAAAGGAPLNSQPILQSASFPCYDGRLPMVRLTPGQKWEQTIYLQHFTESLRPARYEVAYDVLLPFAPDPNVHTSEFLAGDIFMSGQGRLSFLVEPASPERLEKMIRRYASDSGQDAETALSLIDDPVVIPYLVKRIENCWSQERLSDALARFRTDRRVKPMLVANLSSTDKATVCRTLGVLADLKIDIGKGALDLLLKDTNDQIGYAVHRYITMMDEFRLHNLN